MNSIVRWLGTGTYLTSMVLTAINIYPLNLIFGAIGGILWCIAGVQYKDKALILVEAASALIYLSGLILWSMK